MKHETYKSDCIFCKISAGEIPAEIRYEDDLIIAFNDIQPVTPIHVLIIPKKHIASLNDLTESDFDLMGHLMLKVKEIAQIVGAKNGYRLITNTGADSGQIVHHLHFHLLGGAHLGPKLR